MCDLVEYLVINKIWLQKEVRCSSVIETYALGLLDESKTLKKKVCCWIRCVEDICKGLEEDHKN